MVKACLCLILALLLLPHAAMAAITAKFDRQQIAVTDTVFLIIEKQGGDQPQVDFSPLQAHFELIEQKADSWAQKQNGRWQNTWSWTLKLRPRHAGEIQLAALPIGAEQTPPLHLSVSAGPEAEPAFLRLELHTPKAGLYVQQYLDLSVSLYYRQGEVHGQIQPGKLPPGLELHPVGQAKTLQRRVKGVDYHVRQWSYHLIARQPGTLRLPAFDYHGQLSTRLAYLHTTERPLAVHSKPLDVHILPPPPDYHGHWLAASKVTLSENWPDAQVTLHTGDTLSRSIEVHARGIKAEQLPDLVWPDTPGLRVYPEAAQRQSRLVHGQWQASLRQTVVIMAEQAGETSLPEIVLPWFDVDRGTSAQARLPARQLSVLATTASVPPSSDAARPPATHQTMADWPSVSWPSRGTLVMLLSGLLLLLWLLRLARRAWTSPYRPLRRALHRGDAAAMQSAILSMAATWPQAELSLLAISRRLDGQARYKPVCEELQRLEAALYGQINWHPQTPFRHWRDALNNLAHNTPKAVAPKITALQPLYPEDISRQHV